MKSRTSNTERGQPCLRSKGGDWVPFQGMQKVEVAIRPRHPELREGVQARLLRAPVEWAAPIVDKAAKVVDTCPIGPRVARRRIGKTGAREALAKVREFAVWHTQHERLRHSRLLSFRAAILGAAARKLALTCSSGQGAVERPTT